MGEMKDFKCPNCGGSLEFDSSEQKLSCPHCGGTFDAETFNENTGFAIENQYWDEQNDLFVYTCKSCGGTIMCSEETAATSCPYCGSPVVLTENTSGQYRPSRVIPFKLSKKEAQQKYRDHIKGKFLLPKEFSSEAIIEEIKGVYMPFWIFDGKANAQMWFKGEKIRTWSDYDYDYTETSYYKLFRSGSVRFNDVPVDASSKLADDIAQSVEPFNSDDLVEYNDNYLAGYMADKYDVSAEECENNANRRIINSTESLLRSTTSGFSNVILSDSRVSINDGIQEYVMYPLWLLNVKYKDKNYNFAMNGQTGKFVGDLPMDKGKLVSTALISFVLTFLIVCLIQYMSLRG